MKPVRPYYEALGQASDAILRCKDCSKLVTIDVLQSLGSCTCGCRKVTEVRTLSTWEWFKIRVGLIDFPHRKQFLQEFRGARS